MADHKKLWLSIVLVLLIAIGFWTSSRYPALDEKAMMGGDTPIIGIGFDEWVPVDSNLLWYEEILYNTINWGYTNKQGMTFGLLFAAALMLLFSQMNRYLSENRVTNTFLGLIIGAPLGVCVNCAAPIAQGIRTSGGRAETALSMMISSPSLNIIVLSMLFSLFPLYVVMLKLGLTIVIVLVLIPLITRYFFREELVQAKASNMADQTKLQLLPFDLDALTDATSNSWLHAAKWMVVAFLKCLWYVLLRTVPLMLLAGLLGNALITFLPFETLTSLLPEYGIFRITMAMIFLAMVGTFLPVPIAFDVIISAILFAAGLPIQYVMILLLTLGTFSIYAFFIVKQSISLKVATVLSIGVMGLGIAAGLMGFGFNFWQKGQMRALYAQHLKNDTGASSRELGIPAISYEVPVQSVIEGLINSSSGFEALEIEVPSNIKIEKRRFQNKPSKAGMNFRKLEGMEIGINESQELRLENFVEPFSYGHSIASGDIHGDGWTDVLLTSDDGLALYANVGGRQFVRQLIRGTNFDGIKVSTAALVDMNNDGWLDIYYTTYQQGNHILYNNMGHFVNQTPTAVPTVEGGVMTIASSFGDLDKDGDLDILLGNMTVGQLLKPDLSLSSSRNAIVLQDQEVESGFRLEVLSGKAGETWTTLISDFNDDGIPDLLCGNDFKIPDNYYIGLGNGIFKQVLTADSLFPISTKLTMSIATADINNDLNTDIYFAAATSFLIKEEDKTDVSEEICMELNDSAERRRCIEKMRVHKNLKMAKTRDDVFGCPPEYFRECLVFDLFSEYKWYPEKNQNLCDFIEGWDYYSFLCDYRLIDGHIQYPDSSWLLEIPQAQAANVLHIGSNGSAYSEQAEKFGIKGAGWCWNAKFADLDNDEWQDLYVVNSSFQGFKRDRKFLFKNNMGEGFEDVTATSEMGSFFAINAYTYFDIENDGDLDIIAVPAQAPVFVYINESQTGNSIAFILNDSVGNYFGIGSKIIIHYGEENERHQMRELKSGGGFRSYDAPEFRFGLGEYNKVNKVDIFWSTGDTTRIDTVLGAGAIYKVSRNSS